MCKPMGQVNEGGDPAHWSVPPDVAGGTPAEAAAAGGGLGDGRAGDVLCRRCWVRVSTIRTTRQNYTLPRDSARGHVSTAAQSGNVVTREAPVWEKYR